MKQSAKKMEAKELVFLCHNCLLFHFHHSISQSDVPHLSKSLANRRSSRR